MGLRSRPSGAEHLYQPWRGIHPLGISERRDGLLVVPTSYRPGRPAPLMVLLHGAGGSAGDAVLALEHLAEQFGILLLAPDSRGETWDLVLDELGPDVEFIDRALAHVFSEYSVDEDRVALAGFSDGGSYALSIGVSNGDLFKKIIAFSPGFLAPPREIGRPRIFISHGVRDPVLRIDACSRVIVPRLRRAGYDVLYDEFDGLHTLPAGVILRALSWFFDDLAGIEASSA